MVQFDRLSPYPNEIHSINRTIFKSSGFAIPKKCTHLALDGMAYCYVSLHCEGDCQPSGCCTWEGNKISGYHLTTALWGFTDKCLINNK